MRSQTWLRKTTQEVSSVFADDMRVAEHTGCSFYAGNRLASPKETAVLLHSTQFSHAVGEENFKIVGGTNNEISLRILESLHIMRDKPNLNKTLSSFPLSIV